MIFYFSATGNCKHVAEVIASLTNDKTLSILDVNESELNLKEEKYEGFVTPTYAWGLPSIVTNFLKNTEFKLSKDCFVFYVTTYGTTPGLSSVNARNLLKEKGVKVDSVFSIKMPDTWTPLFNLTDSEKVQNINNQAEKEIAAAASDIIFHKNHKRVRRQLPLIFNPVAKTWYEIMRKTKNLYVEDSCIGCGLCAKKCPVQAIEMKDKKPVWKADQCAMCLGCLHRCPKFAIQYGNGATKKHGQYKNPYAKV